MEFLNQNTPIHLVNGVNIPCIGYGTWQTPAGEVAAVSVRAALEAGYRHIDAASAYGNEEGVGEGIQTSGVRRDEIFLTSKLNNPDHGYEQTKRAFAESLKALKTDYLDLYLIHWPNPISCRNNWEEMNAATWKAMEELYESGQIKAIGVSNFRQHHFEALAKTANVAPMVNQISLSPGLTQTSICSYCQEHGMVMEAYSPLGTGRILQLEEMRYFAEKYNHSIAQICIRWSLQMGFIPLPKSINASRIRENINVFDFKLSDEDVSTIASIQSGSVARDPDTINF